MIPETKQRIAQINSGIIPEGYKKTKVGIVPVEWEVTNLGEKAHIETGSKNTQDKVDNGKYPFFVRSQTIEHIDSYSYDCEAVITAGDGVGVGKVYHYINGKFDCHQRVYIVNKFHNALGKYIFFYVSNYFYHRVMKMNAKNSVDSVRMEMLSKMPIPFPPLPEQQKIAEILSTQDKLIELYERKIEQLKTLKKGYLQKMFPKKGCKYPELRFKGFTEPWEQGELSKIADVRDGTHDSPHYLTEGHPFITSKNVGGGYINYDDIQFISDEDFEEINKRSKVDKNDILMGMIGTIGNIALVRESPNFAIKNVALIKDIGAVNYLYLYHYLQSKNVSNQLSSDMNGGTQKFIALSKIRSLKISMPTVVEQQIVGEYMENLDRLITLHQHKLDKEKQKKKALMQLLLTGKVRVST